MQVHQATFVDNEVGVGVAVLREKSTGRRTKDGRAPHRRIQKERMCAHLDAVQDNLQLTERCDKNVDRVGQGLVLVVKGTLTTGGTSEAGNHSGVCWLDHEDRRLTTCLIDSLVGRVDHTLGQRVGGVSAGIGRNTRGDKLGCTIHLTCDGLRTSYAGIVLADISEFDVFLERLQGFRELVCGFLSTAMCFDGVGCSRYFESLRQDLRIASDKSGRRQC